VGLFQSTPAAPRIKGFSPEESYPLPRGDANFLVTLTFHVEQ
jgi:hypothetical protein